MFGIDLGSFIIIMIIAIIFLGPDKLPEVLVQAVKIFRSLRTTVMEAKDSIQKEIDIHELKSTAMGYKEKIEEMAKETLAPLETHKNEASNIFGDLNKEFSEASEKLLSEPTKHPEAEVKAVEK
jgi:sec-independent protein translocase protein TatB